MDLGKDPDVAGSPATSRGVHETAFIGFNALPTEM
jgi:hypothetical protein